MDSLRIIGIVLAAGSGSRMGQQNKQLLDCQGVCMLERVVTVAVKSDLFRVIVVLGYDADRILGKVEFSRSEVVINKHFKKGQGTSIAAGLSGIKDIFCHGVMVMLADQPLICKDIINKLIISYRLGAKSIVVPTFKLKKGPPVIFDRYFFSELSQLSGDFGGRFLLSKYNEKIIEVPVGSGSLFMDVDTPEDYETLCCQGLGS